MRKERDKRHPGPATLEPQQDDNPVPEPPEEATWGSEGGGGDYRRKAEIVLRRVNDVPGSTETQRRWHIERVEWSRD